MRKTRIIRVSEEVYAELETIRRLTNLSVSRTATQALRFALDHSYLVGAESFDIEFGERKGEKK